jgi:hypothetical protein
MNRLYDHASPISFQIEGDIDVAYISSRAYCLINRRVQNRIARRNVKYGCHSAVEPDAAANAFFSLSMTLVAKKHSLQMNEAKSYPVGNLSCRMMHSGNPMPHPKQGAILQLSSLVQQ